MCVDLPQKKNRGETPFFRETGREANGAVVADHMSAADIPGSVLRPTDIRTHSATPHLH